MRAMLLTCLLASSLALADEAPGPAAHIIRLDELYQTRDEPTSYQSVDSVVRKALLAFPDDYDLLWRAARVRWWAADGERDDHRKKKLAKEGWDFASRAVAARADGAEAKYYLALSIGAYSQAVGILAALAEGLEGRFVDAIDYVNAHAEDFDRAGGRTAKGRYYWELPWFKRDLKKSRIELDRGLTLHPENLRDHFYLAQTLARDGDKGGAQSALENVLGGSEAYDPPEARRVKAWAASFAAELER